MTGRIHGRVRPEYGPDIYDLVCDVCGAGWCGKDGEACWWCQRTLEELQADQRRELLWPRWLPDRDDRRYPGSLHTWVRRLARAVQSGLITPAQAEAATRRVKAER